MISYEQYVLNSAVKKEVIDTFLDLSSRTWARFDPELGYILSDSLPHDGIDGCWTISTAREDGARTSHMYPQLACRINTYGNSFTQCHQVSDGETWQEYLAAHLGEPIRNFGMGGYGVSQSYRRMIRTERSKLAARYVLLYIWGDDHLRSALRCRHALIYPSWDHRGGLAFHNNFWTHIEIDLASGGFVEKENLLPTEESLYRMCDPDFMLEALRDDLMLQLCLLSHVDPASIDFKPLNALAEWLGTPGFDGAGPPSQSGPPSESRMPTASPPPSISSIRQPGSVREPRSVCSFSSSVTMRRGRSCVEKPAMTRRSSSTSRRRACGIST